MSLVLQHFIFFLFFVTIDSSFYGRNYGEAALKVTFSVVYKREAVSCGRGGNRRNLRPVYTRYMNLYIRFAVKTEENDLPRRMTT